MENTNLRTPTEWEEYYLNYLQNDVNNQMNQNRNITQNIVSGFFPSQNANRQILDNMRQYRNHLEDYNITAEWFNQRNLYRFPNFLNAVKIDSDNAIRTMEQTYNNGIMSDQKDFSILKKSQNDIAEIYRKMNEDRMKSFEKNNEMWRKYFIG